MNASGTIMFGTLAAVNVALAHSKDSAMLMVVAVFNAVTCGIYLSRWIRGDA